MYEKTNSRQLSFEDFYLPFGGHLKGDNRWVKLANEIDWDYIVSAKKDFFSRH